VKRLRSASQEPATWLPFSVLQPGFKLQNTNPVAAQGTMHAPGGWEAAVVEGEALAEAGGMVECRLIT